MENLDYDYVLDWFLVPLRFSDLKPGCNFPLRTHHDESSERGGSSSLHNHVESAGLPKGRSSTVPKRDKAE